MILNFTANLIWDLLIRQGVPFFFDLNITKKTALPDGIRLKIDSPIFGGWVDIKKSNNTFILVKMDLDQNALSEHYFADFKEIRKHI